MGVGKKKTTTKFKVRKAPTKREVAKRRVAKMHKLIEHRKRTKRDNKRKNTSMSLKNKKQEEADAEIIDFSTKNQVKATNDMTNEEANILQILGIGSGENGWEKKLQERLNEINSTSLENPQVRKVYSEVGRILSTYRSGKIPKAFKIIPKLQKWQQTLALTRPQEWTSQGMYQAVVVFASNLDPTRAETFYKNYLSPAIRRDLAKNKKLNYHYFQSLKKALYKTNAWFKGILFEFCQTQTHLREVKVFEALLSKMSIPVISSSVAIIKLTEFQPCTAVVHYLLALISKHYNLPKRVIGNLVLYLLKSENIQEELPVVWQQLFLNFVKQYSNGIDEMQKGALEALARKKSHKLITPQILKVLSESL